MSEKPLAYMAFAGFDVGLRASNAKKVNTREMKESKYQASVSPTKNCELKKLKNQEGVRPKAQTSTRIRGSSRMLSIESAVEMTCQVVRRLMPGPAEGH